MWRHTHRKQRRQGNETTAAGDGIDQTGKKCGAQQDGGAGGIGGEKVHGGMALGSQCGRRWSAVRAA
jgi:hypothetical protein